MEEIRNTLTQDLSHINAGKFLQMIKPSRFACELTVSEIYRALIEVGQLTVFATEDELATRNEIINDLKNEVLDRAEEAGFDREYIKNQAECIPYRTVASIEWMAKIDNPSAYMEHIGRELWMIITNPSYYVANKLRESGLAKIAYIMLHLVLMYDDNGRGDWWEYSSTNHRWNLVREHIAYRRLRDILHHVDTILKTTATTVTHDIQLPTDQSRVPRVDIANMIILPDLPVDSEMQLAYNWWHHAANECDKDPNLIRRAMADYVNLTAVSTASRDKFCNLRNMNPHVLNVGSGVIARSGKNLVLRDGTPEDYITYSTQAKYNKDLTEDDPRVKEVRRIVSQILLDEEQCRYFWRIMASTFMGFNAARRFLSFIGAGSNGKSTFVSLMEAAFGSNYVIKWDSNVIMENGRGGNGSGPSPSLVSAKGARWVIVQENNNTDYLNTGFVKNITGSDSIVSRELFQKGGDVLSWYPTFVPLLITNGMPRIRDTNTAIYDRLEITLFQSAFYDPYNPRQHEIGLTPEEQEESKIYPKDSSLVERIPTLAEAFLWCSIKAFDDLAQKNFNYAPPASVMDEVSTYRMTQNHASTFLSEMYDVVPVRRRNEQPPDNTGVSIRLLHREFIEWCRAYCIPMSITPALFAVDLANMYPNNLNDQRQRNRLMFGLTRRPNAPALGVGTNDF